MSRFLEALHSGRVLLMDGAMGTELQRAGIRPGACYELWNLTESKRVRAVHQAYAAAGAECLVTNTFQANPVALARHELQDRMEALHHAALSHARAVTPGDRFVLASIGPMEESVLNDALSQTVPSLCAADALLLETWSDPLALWAAQHTCRAARELAGVPVLLSVTYRSVSQPSRTLTTQSGHPPEWFALQAEQNGIAALGVNCGRDIGMDEIIEIVRRYRQVTRLPLFARPNAGTPERDGTGWKYPWTATAMAERLPELLDAGVAMLGGCCGTTPEHIAAFRPIIDAWNARRLGERGASAPC
jgi:5-methyltetrahydrofolate--homocysteine methyltransferase